MTTLDHKRFLTRGVLVLTTFALLSAAAFAAPPATRPGTDSAGRAHMLPERIERVFAADPASAVLVYTLAPELLLGWSEEPGARHKRLLATPYASLPVLGVFAQGLAPPTSRSSCEPTRT